MKRTVFSLCLLAILFACKKDRKDEIIPTIVKEPKHEMLLVTTLNHNDLGWGTQQVFAAISDFDGNVLDFVEVVPGTTTTLSTGDPEMTYFDFHLFYKVTGQFSYQSAGSYHNITGDTLYLGTNYNTLTNSTHSTLTVQGMPHIMDDVHFESGLGNVDITGGTGTGFDIKCEIRHSSLEDLSMYLTYGKHGDEKYRFYWNKKVPAFSNITVQHDELEEIAPLVTMNFPEELEFEYLSVSGIPKESSVRQVLANVDVQGTSAVPVFIPKNFATDFYTDVTVKSATEQYRTYFQTGEIPKQYAAPVTNIEVQSIPGVSVNISGSGFDTYNVSFGTSDPSSFWYVKGPFEETMNFKFPLLSDDQKSLVGVDPTQLSATPGYQSVTKYEPSIPFFYSLPGNNYEVLPFERRDVVSKL